MYGLFPTMENSFKEVVTKDSFTNRAELLSIGFKNSRKVWILKSSIFVKGTQLLIMIPRFGAEGAAIASVIAETVVSVLYVKFSCGYGNISVLLKTGGKKMLAGIFMFCIVFYLNRLQMNSLLLLAIQVAVGCSVYVAFLLVTRDVWTQSMFEKVWRKVKHG